MVKADNYIAISNNTIKSIHKIGVDAFALYAILIMSMDWQRI